MSLNPIITDDQELDLNRITARTAEIGLGTKLQSLSSTDALKGASQIGIEDAAGVFTATDVEGALQELAGAGGIQVDLIFKAATTLTIASGSIVATQAAHKIDTESAAASDDLDSITGGTAEEIIFIRAASAARTVVLKHGVGADLIACPAGRDISLAEATDFAVLYHNGTQWLVVGFSTLSKSGGGIGNALASTANALGASLVGLEDSAARITAANVEAAIAELAAAGYRWLDQQFVVATELTIASGAITAQSDLDIDCGGIGATAIGLGAAEHVCSADQRDLRIVDRGGPSDHIVGLVDVHRVCDRGGIFFDLQGI